ncbi:hypothetical protein [Arvimicrobium flavum]|uniref:hypothetical protein n=1 Tax=Arvimicrobium flavum TaxID=3393320 RepID=UPI00237AD4D6|nr:hypothetical protein [Mesorhizobium shangrilense]
MDDDVIEEMRRFRARIKRARLSGVFMFADGSAEFYENGQRHSEDGPAVLAADGSLLWYRRDRLHRDDGPAIEEANGNRAWYRHGKLHRDDGLALIVGGRMR